jgi:hypothetical protein
MAQQDPSHIRPLSPQHAPDPASQFDRSRPEKESGMGDLNSPIGSATPTHQSENLDRSASNAHPGDRQLNAHDDPGGTGGAGQPLNQIDLSKPAPKQPDHSMREEEPMGSDDAPTDIKDPRQQRHPRTGGKGGTPDAGEPNSRG